MFSIKNIRASIYEVIIFFIKKIQIGPDLKLCWFVVTRLGLQETCESKNFFDVIPEKNFFSHQYIINKD